MSAVPRASISSAKPMLWSEWAAEICGTSFSQLSFTRGAVLAAFRAKYLSIEICSCAVKPDCGFLGFRSAFRLVISTVSSSSRFAVRYT
jgi:hypothetical protein